MTNTNLTAIVLAGGQSSRMGEDKALIQIQGIPMLQRVCSIAQACADTVYVVTPGQNVINTYFYLVVNLSKKSLYPPHFPNP